MRLHIEERESFLPLPNWVPINWSDLPDSRVRAGVARDRGHVGQESEAERFFEKHEIYPSDKLQWAFMSMEGVAMLWFQSWCQEDFDADWESSSHAMIRGFGECDGGSVAEGLTIEEGETNSHALDDMKREEENPNDDGFGGRSDETHSWAGKMGDETSPFRVISLAALWTTMNLDPWNCGADMADNALLVTEMKEKMGVDTSLPDSNIIRKEKGLGLN
ncbi:hypothetical protein E2542_SST09245 [Spatholobus suberectus]|nr:hypothetical protein E2542_SST09245 [Spatholobus suberectus]